MRFSLARLSARGLFAIWGAYWLALLAVAGHSLLRIIALVSAAPRGHSSVRADFDDGVVRVIAMLDGRAVEGGSASLLALALWIAGPPLVLWLVWLARRPRPAASGEGARAPLLPAQRWTPSEYHATLRQETMRDGEP